MTKNLVIFEAEGGNDKWINGLRKDTLPIIDAFKSKGWNCEVLYFRDEWRVEIFNYVKQKFTAFLSRINPGNLPFGESKYYDFLTKLCHSGLLSLSHSEDMRILGAKDVLSKLSGTALVPPDTFSYNSFELFRQNFPLSLSNGNRVLKQNRGSAGRGIWKVEILLKAEISNQFTLSGNTKLKCTEAFDNKSYYFSLSQFMKVCEKYFQENDGILIDMPFLPEIENGEFRVLMVGNKPIQIIQKVPQKNGSAFSATLFSGAKYHSHSIDNLPELSELVLNNLGIIKKIINDRAFPLIWTMDFIPDTSKHNSIRYFLSEINCSCVGFTTQLDCGIQEAMADEANFLMVALSNKQLKA
ncbi:MAG: Cj0069 family protein [Bacteroidetes bacterium]|nr:Cj0069 family protein [Bacteroidota bacterium]